MKNLCATVSLLQVLSTLLLLCCGSNLVVDARARYPYRQPSHRHAASVTRTSAFRRPPASCTVCLRPNSANPCWSCTGFESRCDASFEIARTCADFQLEVRSVGSTDHPYNVTVLQANCRDGNGEMQATEVTLDHFLDPNVNIGGVNYTQSCSGVLESQERVARSRRASPRQTTPRKGGVPSPTTNPINRSTSKEVPFDFSSISASAINQRKTKVSLAQMREAKLEHDQTQQRPAHVDPGEFATAHGGAVDENMLMWMRRANVTTVPEVIVSRNFNIGSDNESSSTNGEENFIFGDDVQFIILATGRNHPFVAKSLSTWGRYIKRISVFSDTLDEDLGAIVLKNPFPERAVQSQLDNLDFFRPWRVTSMLSFLHNSTEKAPFYIVLEDRSFPLLDVIKQRLELYKLTMKGKYPPFIAGKRNTRRYDTTFFADQAALGTAYFGSDRQKGPLLTVANHLYGFNAEFLKYVSEYLTTDACPLLPDDDATLGAVIACAGGHVNGSEFNFVTETAWNYEWKLRKQSSLADWRRADVYGELYLASDVKVSYQLYYRKLEKSSRFSSDLQTSDAMDPHLRLDGGRHVARPPSLPGAGARNLLRFHEHIDRVMLISNCRKVGTRFGGTLIGPPPLSLNSVLINLEGQLSLIAPMKYASRSYSRSSSCRLQQCEIGSRRITSNLGISECVPCHDTDTAVIAKPGFYCNGSDVDTCPLGSYCLGGDKEPQPCGDGCLCNGASTSCPEPCTAGMFCESGKKPQKCPEGKYCPAGLKNSLPLPCEGGCICSSGSAVACPEECPRGTLCNAFYWRRYCPIGNWCARDRAIPCPAGRFGSQLALKNDSCSGQCDGWFWTSKSAAMGCFEMSTMGIILTTAVAYVIVTSFLSVTWFTTSKVCSNRRHKDDDRLSDNLAADSRRLVQARITTTVEAVVSRAVKQAFPSTINLSSILLHLNLSPADMEESIATAKKELSDHLNAKLLSHPRVAFDDDTYPHDLPAWLNVDPTSPEGQIIVIDTGTVIGNALMTAVHHDLIESLKKQHPGMMTMQSTLQDEEYEANESLLHASPINSSWPTVDTDLQVKLRTMLMNSESMFPGLRVPYSPPPTRQLLKQAVSTLLRLCCDIFVIVACAFCVRGDSLFTIKFPLFGHNAPAMRFTSQERGFVPDWVDFVLHINWKHVNRPPIPIPFLEYIDGNLDWAKEKTLFHPILDDCLGTIGKLYFDCHVITLILFSITCLCGVISFGNLMFLNLVRGCASPMIGGLPPKFVAQPSTDCFQIFYMRTMRGDGIALLRILGMLSLILAVSVYTPGCYRRMHQAPAIGLADLKSVHTRSWADVDPPPLIRLEHSLELSESLVLSLIAAGVAIITAGISLQQAWASPVLANRSIERAQVEVAERRDIVMQTFSGQNFHQRQSGSPLHLSQ